MGRSSRHHHHQHPSSSSSPSPHRHKRRRQHRHRDRHRSRSRGEPDHEDEPSPSIDLHDKDVWFDNPKHPGTRECRRAIRLVLEDFHDDENDDDDEDEEKVQQLSFSKSVYKAILRELGSRRRFFTSDEKSSLSSLRECDEDESIDHLEDVFRVEQSRRLEKIRKKSSSRRHTIDRERSSTPPTRRREDHKKRKRKIRHSSDQDDGDSSTDDQEDYHRESSRKRKSRSETRRSKRHAEKVDRKSSSKATRRPIIYLDETDDKDTKKFRKVVRNIAAADGQSKRFTPLVLDEILEETGHPFTTMFFKSRSSERELKGDKLSRTIGKVFKEEAYLLRARPDDIFLDCPYYSGTKAWDRAIRKQIKRNGGDATNTNNLSRDVYHEVKREFRESSFFVGRPPHCEVVDRSELFQILSERYDDAERKKQVQSPHYMQFDTDAPKTADAPNMKKRRARTSPDGRDHNSSPRSRRHGRNAPIQRPIPGNALWINLGQRMSNRLAMWQWYQRQRKKLEALPMVISCRARYARCYKEAILPVYAPTRKFFRTDRRTGQTWCGKVGQCLEVPHLGRAPAWFILILLVTILAITVFAIINRILQRIVGGFIN